MDVVLGAARVELRVSGPKFFLMKIYLCFVYWRVMITTLNMLWAPEASIVRVTHEGWGG